MTSLDSATTDSWLVPLLTDLLPPSSLKELEAAADESYWRTAVDKALLTDDELLEAIASRARVRVATDLLVSSPALEKVPERLARRFRILPLAVSDSTLDIATSNPYDLDCEMTLAFATARRVRMCLA